MTFHFRPATRENVGLIIGLIGPSGGGKTYTAMRLAAGIAGDKPFCVIDTEAGRAKHYADRFKFDHGDLKPPFRPGSYADAIRAADDAGYPVIVVDSASHEWAGEGGILDWQEEELTRMAGDNYGKREACKMAAWIKPKTAHKQMVQRLLQVRAHLILCFRAEEKVKMERDSNNKMQIIPIGWQPICEKNLPFELTCSLLLTPDAPGVPKPLKLQEQHRELFPAGEPVTESSGRRLAEWATGAPPASAPETPRPPVPPESADPDAEAPINVAHGGTGSTLLHFFHPGNKESAGSYGSFDEWMAAWITMCELIEKSAKLSIEAKGKKLRALREANEGVIAKLTVVDRMKVSGDVQRRLRALTELEKAEAQ